MNTQTKEVTTMDCRTMKTNLPTLLPDLLLDPAAVPAAARQHIDTCAECRQTIDRELGGHTATLHLLDHWQAPPVSPYFHSRMGALLREEQARPPAGIFARMRSWLLLTDLHMKPVAGAAALGVLLAVGGGAYLDLSHSINQQGQQAYVTPAPQASATVRDLQSLDENAQVFQEMSSLDSNDDDSSNGSSL